MNDLSNGIAGDIFVSTKPGALVVNLFVGNSECPPRIAVLQR